MSLLTLLLGILSALAPIAGVNLLEPSPEAAVLPARELVLEPQCEGELTGLEEERMMAAIQYRCELVGLRGVQVRREGCNFLVQVNSGLIPTMEEYAETLDELEAILNERTNMQLLRVHPDSEILVRDGEVQELLVEYETAVVAYEEHPGEIEGLRRFRPCLRVSGCPATCWRSTVWSLRKMVPGIMNTWWFSARRLQRRRNCL